MNLLEHYIKEVVCVSQAERKSWMKEDYVDAALVVDCYGRVEHLTIRVPESEWEEIKKKGYYMA